MPELCVLDVPDGACLEDMLFERGVEFPCGGYSQCGGCRVHVIEGNVPVTSDMREALTPEELANGWRLACQARVTGRVVLRIGQWDAPILSDDAAVHFEAREGFGIAVDLGTTTLVAQLLDLRSGRIVDVRTALNPQSAHGADLMSRVQFDMTQPGVLTRSVREALRVMVRDLTGNLDLREVLICGNTVMHHLFCGLSVEPLAHVPFESAALGEQRFTSAELEWDVTPDCRVSFLPCMGGFVGSDILAGLVAVPLFDSTALVSLIDLGTNGEIVVGDRNGAICVSTAAGPAFEAGRIRMGMRAARGAISRVSLSDGGFQCHVIGGGPARGICGSGLVDGVAAALSAGRILPSGRLANGAREMPLVSAIGLTQSDIRELQLAKGAIAAGLKILLHHFQADVTDLKRLYLGGAFGNYVSIESAHRIGLLAIQPERVEASGNTALRGVKMLLGMPSRREKAIDLIRSRTRHISLASDAEFEDTFVASLAFP